MNRYTMGRRAALAVLAMTVTAGLGSQAVGQSETPNLPARDPNSARSSPPDTTPYVRPIIPQDLVQTPFPEAKGRQVPGFMTPRRRLTVRKTTDFLSGKRQTLRRLTGKGFSIEPARGLLCECIVTLGGANMCKLLLGRG